MKPTSLFRFLGSVFILCLCACAPQGNFDADLLLYNGRLYTVDAERSWAEALAIKDGKIVFVGSNEEAEAWKAKSAEMQDLGGKMVMPGIHDAHVHPISGAEASRFCQLTGLFTQAEIVEALEAFAEANPDVEVLRGRGWEISVFPNSNPQRVF